MGNPQQKLTQALLTKTIPTTFGVEYQLDKLVDALTVDIDVKSGSSLANYNRSSTVKGSPTATGIDFDETFSFALSNYGLGYQGGAIVDVNVDMKFKDGIGVANPFDYPEFVSIVNYIKGYLVRYPNEAYFWEILNKNLAASLLSQTIPTTFGVSYKLNDIVDDIVVDIQVKPGSSLVNLPRASTVNQSFDADARQASASVGLTSLPASSPPAQPLQANPGGFDRLTGQSPFLTGLNPLLNSVGTTAAKGFKAFTWPDQVNVNWLLQRNSTTIGLGAATALNKVWGTNGGSGAGLTALIATSTPSSLFSGANPLGMNPWPRPGDTLASIPGLFRGNAPDGSQPMVGSPLLPTM